MKTFGILALSTLCSALAGSAPLPVVDLSADASGDVVVAAGTEKVYQGHPTTVRTTDGRIIAVWCTPHGGWCGPAAESKDGGRTWARIDKRFPKDYKRHENCPSIYRLTDSDGKSRLWVWSEAKIAKGKKNFRDFDGAEWMPSVMSEDEGLTWREMPALGPKFECVMAFTTVVRLKDGSYLALFHARHKTGEEPGLRVWQSITKDGGFTWSDPVVVCWVKGKNVCEPYVFRSPKGDELCCLLRENNHKGCSMMMFSTDEGRTWSKPVDTPWGLTGDRHQVVRLKDGRFLVAFRDMALKSPTFGDFVAWVGTYDELKGKSVGNSFRIKLLHSYAKFKQDCGYCGLELLDDGTVLATTYIKYRDDGCKQSVVAKRFVVPKSALDFRPPPHIVAKVSDCERYESLNPHFKKAFAFLKRKDLAELKCGRYDIDGDNCWAMVQEAKLTPFAESKIEAHRKYIDIQAPITGPETIGLFTMDAAHRSLPFNAKNDCVLFSGVSEPRTLRPGEFAIFFPPNGAHAPGHTTESQGTIRKLVIKVRAE